MERVCSVALRVGGFLKLSLRDALSSRFEASHTMARQEVHKVRVGLGDTMDAGLTQVGRQVPLGAIRTSRLLQARGGGLDVSMQWWY